MRDIKKINPAPYPERTQTHTLFLSFQGRLFITLNSTVALHWWEQLLSTCRSPLSHQQEAKLLFSSLLLGRNKIEKTKETCQRLYGVDFATQKESSIKANKDAAKKRSWDKMINICKTLDVEPAFTFDDWHGYGFDKQYPWKCLTCGEIFYHSRKYSWDNLTHLKLF